MIEILRSRRSVARVKNRLASRRSINRVILPLSLPRATASCPGVILRASTHRTSTLASWTVIPNLRKQRFSDVCNVIPRSETAGTSAILAPLPTTQRPGQAHAGDRDENAPDFPGCSYCGVLAHFQKPDAYRPSRNVRADPTPTRSIALQGDADRNLLGLHSWKLCNPLLVGLDFNFLLPLRRFGSLPIDESHGSVWERAIVLSICDLETESVTCLPGQYRPRMSGRRLSPDLDLTK